MTSPCCDCCWPALSTCRLNLRWKGLDWASEQKFWYSWWLTHVNQVSSSLTFFRPVMKKFRRLDLFRRICPEVDTAADRQQLDGVQVRHWRDQDGVYTPADVADIVIEFFAVDIPPGYIEAMAQCEPRPVWFNLEGLTAEEWVEGCHRLTSPHPRL